MAEGEFDLCFVGRALIADCDWCEKVRAGRYDELDQPYSRKTLMRFEEGGHPVPAADFRFVRPVDADGKPVRDLSARGLEDVRNPPVYWPTTVPREAWDGGDADAGTDSKPPGSDLFNPGGQRQRREGANKTATASGSKARL